VDLDFLEAVAPAEPTTASRGRRRRPGAGATPWVRPAVGRVLQACLHVVPAIPTLSWQSIGPPTGTGMRLKKSTDQRMSSPRLVVRQARRQNGGRRFAAQRELSLAAAAREAMGLLPGSDEGLLVRQEAAGPFGIPDFLCLSGDLEVWRRRRRLLVPPILNPVDASIVAQASDARPYGVKTLAKFARLPEATVERRMPHLLQTGGLLEYSASTVVRPNALRPLGRLFAVEMKVKDWQKALHQCRRY
jgi:hypothetical protein